MKWTEYAADKLYRILLHLAGMLALAAFLLATGTARGVVLLVLLAWALCLAAMLAAGFAAARARLHSLQALMDGLDNKTLFAECAPPAKTRYEAHLFALMRRSGRAMVQAVSDAQAGTREYREYIENWVHEIKAPITAAQLACRNSPAAMPRKLLPQLAQIDGHVERALFYARAGSVEKDFAIRQTQLADIAAQALARHKPLLIAGGVRVETTGLDIPVYTDSQWAVFILGQLLANAARYRGEAPEIRLEGKRLGNLACLTVWDNGPGIPPQDLPRIFDKGFTGCNGRRAGGATGMGLYIAKKLAAHLQVEIAAASVPGQYTRFTLTFPARANLSQP